MNQSKHYTAEEIERYHSGQLSAAEMHALEKAALDDPFLADALEGYRQTTTASNDLSQLQQKLELRIGKDRKRRGLFLMNTGWMRVAALFILFAGGGWLVFQLVSGNNAGPKTEIATNQTVKQEQSPATDASADSTNSIVSNSPSATAPSIIPQQNNGDVPSKNDVAINRRSNTTISPSTYSTQPTIEVREDQVNSLQEITTMRQLNTMDSLSLRGVTAAKEKDNAKAAAVDTIRNVNVVMTPTQLPADEVVVLNTKPAPMARKRMQVVIDTLEPAEGWTNFDDYIAGNLKTPEEFKSKPIRGEVELSFDVNNAGQPVNITVVKSLCEKCDEEAIRLLKEGPKWKQNRKKGKVKIRF